LTVGLFSFVILSVAQDRVFSMAKRSFVAQPSGKLITSIYSVELGFPEG